jgi:hypothetical protein
LALPPLPAAPPLVDVAPPLAPPLHLPQERAHAPFNQLCVHQPY